MSIAAKWMDLCQIGDWSEWIEEIFSYIVPNVTLMLAEVRWVYEQIDKMPRDQTHVCNPFAAMWAVCGFLAGALYQQRDAHVWHFWAWRDEQRHLKREVEWQLYLEELSSLWEQEEASGTMKVHGTRDAPGTDEAAWVGSPPPRVDNHRLWTCLRCHTGCTNKHWNYDELRTRRNATTFWTSTYNEGVESIATCPQWKYQRLRT